MSPIDQVLKEELIRINQGNRKTLKTIYAEGDEIKPLWDLDFCVGDMVTKVHVPEKGRFVAYCITRVSDLNFFIHKVQISYWWIDTEVEGEVRPVRSSAVIYEDTPADILTVQKVLYLNGWKFKSSAQWQAIFEILMDYIKSSPSDINGKILPNLKQFINNSKF